jgi:hypothetical protein
MILLKSVLAGLVIFYSYRAYILFKIRRNMRSILNNLKAMEGRQSDAEAANAIHEVVVAAQDCYDSMGWSNIFKLQKDT